MNPTIATYFFHILQGQLSLLIVVLDSLSVAEFFIESGRRSHSLGAGEEKLSEP